MATEHAGHRQRMRERFLADGLQGFASHEILELILFFAIPQRNVNPLAHQLINHFGSLHAVLDAPVEELEKVDGVGRYAATLLSLFSHVSRQLSMRREGEKHFIGNRRLANEHCFHLLRGLPEEHFYVVCMDAKFCLIKDVPISRGTLNEVPAYPRLVAEAVLRHNAHAVVLCHNHPGGSELPSQQDVEITQQLGLMLSSLGVVLADHVIVSGKGAFSMVSHGLITHEASNNSVQAKVADSANEIRIRHTLAKQQEKSKA